MEYTIKGKLVLVDDNFILQPELFSVYKNRNTFYCYRKADAVFLHHLVIGKQDGKVVDHIDNNGLNNKTENLRFVSYSENRFNSRAFNYVKGIYACTKTGKFYARIKIEGKRKSYGPFFTETEALAKYKELFEGRVAE